MRIIRDFIAVMQLIRKLQEHSQVKDGELNDATDVMFILLAFASE